MENKFTVLKNLLIAILFIIVVGCTEEPENGKIQFGVLQLPEDTPIPYTPVEIPTDYIIHKGLFGPDLKSFYFTLSDPDFDNFDIYFSTKNNNGWSKPKPAFFNSEYNDHGMCFTPDGKSIYFSSTRPVLKGDVTPTWHIWKTELIDGNWTDPEFFEIPGFNSKLVSHPSVSENGEIFFHSSEIDYSNMKLYSALPVDGNLLVSELNFNLPTNNVNYCTPLITSSGDKLVFAAIRDHLELMISNREDVNGTWSVPKKLKINSDYLGQGNPFFSPNEDYLFFTVEEPESKKWFIMWVNFNSIL